MRSAVVLIALALSGCADVQAERASKHAAGVAECYSNYAKGGLPINSCYELLPMENREAWVLPRFAGVRRLLLDVDREMVNVELMFDIDSDNKFLIEIPDPEVREKAKLMAQMVAQAYETASKRIREEKP